ncbi:MAG: hypothetical protein H7839_07885 [Magnetococcus sp. YQC-5]
MAINQQRTETTLVNPIPAQDAVSVMTTVFQNARNGTLSEKDFVFVLTLLLDAGNQNLALDLANTWNTGRKRS